MTGLYFSAMTGNAMIIDNPENRPLAQYPRNIVLAAEQYMKDTGIADTMLILLSLTDITIYDAKGSGRKKLRSFFVFY